MSESLIKEAVNKSILDLTKDVGLPNWIWLLSGSNKSKRQWKTSDENTYILIEQWMISDQTQ
jgi:hypothetical protein